MVAADDDIIWPLIGNDDLIAIGLPPEDDDDTRDDATALFGVDVGSSSAVLIDLDDDSGEGVTTTGTSACSNDSASSVAGNSSGVGTGKRKSVVLANFDEIYETVNGRKIYTKATCKICKHTLFVRSNAGTGHLKRH